MSKITQLVRGTVCNARCPMCLSLRNNYGSPDKRAFMDEDPNYVQLVDAYRTALEMGSNELVITSFGDPLANHPWSLPAEIQSARMCGFEQVTLLTNAVGLTTSLLNGIVNAGLTHLSISLHATRQDHYAEMLGVDVPLGKTLIKGQSASDRGIIVRHNYVWTDRLSLEAVFQNAELFGASQITLIESVPVNDFAKNIHRYLPLLKIGKLVKSHAWGMDIYDVNGISLALCYFGQDDPGFSDQQKNIYINILRDGEVVLREGAWFDLDDRIVR